jgi:hypothetical protein
VCVLTIERDATRTHAHTSLERREDKSSPAAFKAQSWRRFRTGLIPNARWLFFLFLELRQTFCGWWFKNNNKRKKKENRVSCNILWWFLTSKLRGSLTIDWLLPLTSKVYLFIFRFLLKTPIPFSSVFVRTLWTCGVVCEPGVEIRSSFVTGIEELALCLFVRESRKFRFRCWAPTWNLIENFFLFFLQSFVVCRWLVSGCSRVNLRQENYFFDSLQKRHERGRRHFLLSKKNQEKIFFPTIKW